MSITIILANYGKVNELTHAYVQKLLELHGFNRTNSEVISIGNKDGLGDKFKVGVRMAKMDHVMLLPGDGEFNSYDVTQLWEMAKGWDVVIAYPGPDDRSFARRFVSRGFVELCNFLFGIRLPYWNGTNVFKTELVRDLPIISKEYTYMAEVLYRLLGDSDIKKRAVCASVRLPVSTGSTAFKPIVVIKSFITMLKIKFKLADVLFGLGVVLIFWWLIWFTSNCCAF